MHRRRFYMVLIVLLAAMHGGCKQPPAAPSVGLGYVVPTTRLTAEQAAQAEQSLLDKPDDLKTRIDLIWHYHWQFTSPAAQQARLRHLLWIVEHHPQAKVLATAVAQAAPFPDAAAFKLLKALWSRQVKAHPSDAAVLGHAGVFLMEDAPDEALALLVKAWQHDKANPLWTEKLADLYNAKAADAASADDRRQWARQAVLYYRMALRRTSAERRRLYLLQSLATATLRAGDAAATMSTTNDLLKLAAQFKGDSDYAPTVHAAHVLQGRAALISRDAARAAASLRAAAHALQHAQVSLFDLDMTLARDLLARGQRDPVAAYLEACAAATKTEQVRHWLAQIKQGATPDFAAYLH